MYNILAKIYHRPSTIDYRLSTNFQEDEMRLISICLILSAAIFISGCGVFEKARKADTLQAEVGQLKADIDKLQAISQEKDKKYDELKNQKEKEIQRLLEEKEKQIVQVKGETQRKIDELEMARERLAKDLQKEIEIQK